MKYEVKTHSRFREVFDKLDKNEQIRILKKLTDLEEYPESRGKRLRYVSNLRSLRIGKFRAIYTVLKKGNLVMVLAMDHRGKVYSHNFLKILEQIIEEYEE